MPHAEVPKRLRANAKRLRSDMTDVERRLWFKLRAHRLGGIGFRRQVPILNYIVDFAAPEERIVVELDGSQHAEDAHARRDAKRDLDLHASGWTVLRFWNEEIVSNINGVCETILAAARPDGE